jgi:hypothetical protein
MRRLLRVTLRVPGDEIAAGATRENGMVSGVSVLIASIRPVGRLALFAAVVACGALQDAAASAQTVQTLAETKDWELVLTNDPFARVSRQCQVRTRTEKVGGRRERPLIVIDVTSRQIVVRPDITLQGAVQANRALQGDTGDRGGRHTVAIRHGLRVDDAPLHSVEMVDDGSGSLEARFDTPAYEALAAEIRTGKTLFYLWELASSRQAYEFPLAGTDRLLPSAHAECGKAGG